MIYYRQRMKEVNHHTYTYKALRSITAAAIGISGMVGIDTKAAPLPLKPIFPCPTETIKAPTQLFLPIVQKQGSTVIPEKESSQPYAITEIFSAKMVGKIIGSKWGDPPEVNIINGPGTPHYGQILGTDLGPTARYGDTYYSLLGDTVYLDGTLTDNFLVPYFKCSDTPSLPLISGYLKYQNGVPKRALVNRKAELLPNSPVLPTALTTISWKGKQHMFAHYMNTPKWSNFNIAYSTLAKYDDQLQLFTPYKSKTNIWPANERGVSQFALASFWSDEKEGYLYMIGASNDRFGGAKLGRIHLDSFLNESDQTDWQYYLGQNNWSNPTNSSDVINNQAAWLIPPKDPGWTLDKGLSQKDVDWCTLMTVTEHGLIRDPKSGKFFFMYGDADCPPHGIYIHTSDSITGPWSNPPKRIEMPYPSWDYYAPHPIPNTLRHNPTTNSTEMDIFASTYDHYGIYLYNLAFKESKTSPVTPP